MLDAQQIANYLVKNLDAIGKEQTTEYQFSILGEIAKGYVGDKINGMVRTYSAEVVPASGYYEVHYVYVVEMFVSGPTNRQYLNVNRIINTFIKANQNSSVDFENGKGIVTFTNGVPKGYKIAYALGQGVPLTFTVKVTYAENGVLSANKHWLLDGKPIPFLSESVYVEKEGVTRQIYTETYSKTLVTGQTKFYSFRIPYESTVFKALQTEIMNASTADGTKHTLTYYDGEAFTENAPYTATVRVYKSAKSSSQCPDGSVYEVTFTDVYSSLGKSHKYFISLIDFPFDMQGADTRYFTSTEEQTEYFEAKAAASSAPFLEIQAPNLDSLVITKQVYGKTGTGANNWASQFDYVNKNYAIIKVVSDSKTLYFYYFVTTSTIGADGLITVDLKLDTVQTYFFDNNITFSDCLIERAHLNRFVPVSESQVRFVTDPASKIYNSEEGFNFPKRLVKRDKLNLRFTGNDTVDNWLNENVAYWVYIFIDPSHEYTVAEIKYNAETVTKTIPASDMSWGEIEYSINLNGATACICYPIYKNVEKLDTELANIKNAIKINTVVATTTPELAERVGFVPSVLGRSFFEELNNAKSFYYSIKLSIVPPFDSATGVTIDNNNCLNIAATTEKNRILAKTFPAKGALCLSTSDGKMDGVFFGSKQTKKSLPTANYPLSENDTFSKTTLTSQQPPNLEFNPKLNGQNFKELTVTAASGDTFSYDIQKLNNGSVTFEYSEPIQPEVTKYYLRVQGDTGLYEDGTDENYTGLVGSTDNSLAYANDQYAAFIANNKNFYMQSNMKIISGAIQSGIGIGQKIASGNYTGAAIDGAREGLDIATALIDRSLTVDNMKSAPDQLKNANGNVIFNMFATDLGLYAEKYEALEGDLKTANDFMNLYGFTYSAVANVRDFAHIRKYHNYVKAQLQSINGNLSNAARSDLRQRFSDGVRFWNNDNISYQYENYELWLED